METLAQRPTVHPPAPSVASNYNTVTNELNVYSTAIWIAEAPGSDFNYTLLYR